MKIKDPLVNIGFIAERTGASVSAIRFYESENLIPAHRSPAGHRLFHRSVVRRVSFILISQQLGYSLDEIRGALAALPQERTPNKSDWDKLARMFRKDIDSKIERLEKLRDSLSGCIGCGCLSLKRCQLYNRDDHISDKGAGPRFLMGNRAKPNPKK